MNILVAGANDKGRQIAVMIKQLFVRLFRICCKYHAAVHLYQVGLQLLNVVDVLFAVRKLIDCLETNVADAKKLAQEVCCILLDGQNQIA